jgi:acyl carrier protein
LLAGRDAPVTTGGPSADPVAGHGGGAAAAAGHGAVDEPPAAVADPSDALRHRITAIFAEVLGLTAISSTDDFFASGGDSLTATQLTSRVRDELNIDAPLDTIFEHSTVGDFVTAIAALATPDDRTVSEGTR